MMTEGATLPSLSDATIRKISSQSALIAAALILRPIDETVFRDARLGRRFGELLCRLSDRMGGTISLACKDWASTKAAYRFFSNSKVEEGDILAGHFKATKARYAASGGPILVLQDTTEFTYHLRQCAGLRS